MVPSPALSLDPCSGIERRHQLSEERLARALKRAVTVDGIEQHVTVQELLGHSDVSTTMIYTHVLQVAAGGTRSPLDAISGS